MNYSCHDWMFQLVGHVLGETSNECFSFRGNMNLVVVPKNDEQDKGNMPGDLHINECFL